MNRFFSALAAAGLVAGFTLPVSAPASAAPIAPRTAITTGTDVVPVQYNRDAPPPRRHNRGPGYRNDARPDVRRGPPRERRGNWHGYRGYEHRRPGYRRHSDGFWYPLGAFRIQIR